MGHGVNHPPRTSAEIKERVELCIYSLSGSSWPVLGRTSPFTFYVHVIATADFDRLAFSQPDLIAPFLGGGGLLRYRMHVTKT